MVVNYLKLHMFLFYAAFNCVIVYMTVYIRTWTDASYGEIGLISMVCCLSGLFLKPLVCSFADRSHSYKSCLLINLVVMDVCTIPFVLLPYQELVLGTKPNLRLNWYLLATIYPIYFTALATVITFDDVFIVHNCQQSTTNEDIGQYRYLGSVGPTVSTIGVALLENYTSLPYMSTPMLVSCLLLVMDILVACKLENLSEEGRPKVVKSHLGSSKLNMVIMDPNSPARDSVSSTNLPTATTKHQSCDAEADARWSRVSFLEQMELLRQLNRYDNYNLCKYLAVLVLFGAFAQIHYVFFLETLTGLLRERDLLSLVFILTGLIQISIAFGETFSLLWLSRWAIDTVGRDALQVLFICLSALRYAVYGFFMDQLNVWLIAMLDVQTGLLWGIIYNLMVDTPASYLALLDLLLDRDVQTSARAAQLEDPDFLRHLNELKARHSTESIRFALRATLQSLFSGACEGLGFALGPLIGGYWLGSHQGNSALELYQSVSVAHMVALVAMLGLEYGLIRSLLGRPSRTALVRRAPLGAAKAGA